jgi:hypothetical protein
MLGLFSFKGNDALDVESDHPLHEILHIQLDFGLIVLKLALKVIDLRVYVWDDQC